MWAIFFCFFVFALLNFFFFCFSLSEINGNKCGDGDGSRSFLLIVEKDLRGDFLSRYERTKILGWQWVGVVALCPSPRWVIGDDGGDDVG